MPVMDGKETCTVLRSVGFNTPIIALTADITPKDTEQYRNIGFNQYLAKPIERDKFYVVLSSSQASKNASVSFNKICEF